jgi:hypothetical protein
MAHQPLAKIKQYITRRLQKFVLGWTVIESNNYEMMESTGIFNQIRTAYHTSRSE